MINFYCELLPRGFFNQGIFNGNSYTRQIKISNSEVLGSPTVFERFYDLMSFSVEAPKMKALYADFGNRKSFLKNFDFPLLGYLEVKSSHLSANCIRSFQNLKKLKINSFSDLEDLTLPQLEEIVLTSGYSLMLSNCNFPKLSKINVDPDARLPGIINCQLDSLQDLDINSTKTSYIKDLRCSSLQHLNLVHTIGGVLNTLVLDGGDFPAIEKLTVPSPVYLSDFEYSGSVDNIHTITVFIQKEWFYPTIPMYLLKDEVQELTMADELSLLSEVQMSSVTKLTVVIENPSKPRPDNVLVFPDFISGMPNLEVLVFIVQYEELDDPDEVFFDLSFLKSRRLTKFQTNIERSQLWEFDSYQVDSWNTVYLQDDQAHLIVK